MRHNRVLKPLEVLSRDKRRVIGKGPNGLLDGAEKTELKEARAAFEMAWRGSFPNRLLTPKGDVVEVHVPWFVEACGICAVLGEGGLRETSCVRRAAPQDRPADAQPRGPLQNHLLYHNERTFTPAIKRVPL